MFFVSFLGCYYVKFKLKVFVVVCRFFYNDNLEIRGNNTLLFMNFLKVYYADINLLELEKVCWF